MLDKLFITSQKKKLEELKKDIEAKLQEFEDRKHDFGQDEDDDVHETEMYSDNIQIHTILQKQLDEVQAALKRIEEGTYGICEKTGKPIDKARLLAVPEARYCEGMHEN